MERQKEDTQDSDEETQAPPTQSASELSAPPTKSTSLSQPNSPAVGDTEPVAANSGIADEAMAAGTSSSTAASSVTSTTAAAATTSSHEEKKKEKAAPVFRKKFEWTDTVR